MAMLKRRKDGLLKRSFTFEGKRFYVYGHDQKDLCRKEAAKREELSKGIEARKNPKLKDYFTEWDARRAGTVKETTICTQRRIFEQVAKVYIPARDRAFGEIGIADITTADVFEVQRELAKTRSTNCTNQYIDLLRHVMKTARIERLISYDPCEAVSALRRTEESVRESTHRALTDAEIKAFFEADRCKKSFYRNLFLFLIYTGVRLGEAGALMRKDIRGGFIHIERTLSFDETGARIVGQDAKTAAGRRQILVNDDIKRVLNEQKAFMEDLTGVISPDDILFRSIEGGLLLNCCVNKEIKAICQEAGIERFSAHCFRHTFATHAVEAGMPLKTLQKILGHNDFNTTVNTYAHGTLEAVESAMRDFSIAI